MEKSQKIYLDYNATTPVDPRVVDVMLPFFTEQFGNASSSDHLFGWEAEEAVEQAREQVARLIGASATELTFTSGATEAINMALRSFLPTGDQPEPHIITANSEHKAVLDTCRFLESSGCSITYLPVDSSGRITPDQVKESVNKNTVLVCLMHANNETGTIHPLREISAVCKEHNLYLMTDATQSVGKIPVDVNKLGVDILTCSSHKLYGPKGAGVLYINRKNKPGIKPLMTGGGQEKSLRPGTLNVAAIAGFGYACELCRTEMEQDAETMKTLRNILEAELTELDNIIINGAETDRLPNTTNITFLNTDGTHIVRRLKRLAVSRGSACSSATHQPSHVLKALGRTNEEALASIRIGLGRFTTKNEVQQAAKTIKDTVSRLRAVLQ